MLTPLRERDPYLSEVDPTQPFAPVQIAKPCPSTAALAFEILMRLTWVAIPIYHNPGVGLQISEIQPPLSAPFARNFVTEDARPT